MKKTVFLLLIVPFLVLSFSITSFADPSVPIKKTNGSGTLYYCTGSLHRMAYKSRHCKDIRC